MSSYECFSLEIKDHIAHLEMSRPDALNAMNRNILERVARNHQRYR